MNRMLIIATTRPSIIPRLLLDWDGCKGATGGSAVPLLRSAEVTPA